MTPREAFKVAFLYRCADEGLSEEQTRARVKSALARAEMEKRALPGEYAVTEAVKGITGWAPWLGLGGLGLAGGLGWAGGGLLADATKNPDAVEEAKADELLAEYARQAERVKRVQQMRLGQKGQLA
jgi:hypothetical protein